ncbi:MAG TPA: tetratricopeptide repeat protein [Bryobacteraceae bacterium]|nr:tetratricopeptide repeat protein [Bryobacteraceae bacterium]
MSILSLLLGAGLVIQVVAPANGQAAGQTTAPSGGNAAVPGRSRSLTAVERGDIYMARKMYREAIETYMQAPASAAILNKIGIAYHQLADLDNAGKYYQRAIKLDPKFVDAVNNLGTVYYSKKSYRRAIAEFRKVLNVKPDAASTWANLANAYFERKQYDLSTDALQKALELDPNVLESHSSVGSLVQDRNVADRAKYHYYLAKSLAKKGQNADALIYIRKALEEGFKERQKFQEEPEFAGLRDDPEFKQLMATEPKVL